MAVCTGKVPSLDPAALVNKLFNLMRNSIDGPGMQLPKRERKKIKNEEEGKKKSWKKKMQLQRADKVFNSRVHSLGVFPFVISLIKVLGRLSWVWECGRKGAEGGIAAGTGDSGRR